MLAQSTGQSPGLRTGYPVLSVIACLRKLTDLSHAPHGTPLSTGVTMIAFGGGMHETV